MSVFLEWVRFMGIGENVDSSGREKNTTLVFGTWILFAFLSLLSLSTWNITSLLLLLVSSSVMKGSWSVWFPRSLFSFLIFLSIQTDPGYTYRVEPSLTVPVQIHVFLGALEHWHIVTHCILVPVSLYDLLLLIILNYKLPESKCCIFSLFYS